MACWEWSIPSGSQLLSESFCATIYAGSGRIFSIHHHYQKWHTVCRCSCSLYFQCESAVSILRIPVMGWEIHFKTRIRVSLFILLGIFSAVNLIFAVNVQEIKHPSKKCSCSRCCNSCWWFSFTQGVAIYRIMFVLRCIKDWDQSMST